VTRRTLASGILPSARSPLGSPAIPGSKARLASPAVTPGSGGGHPPARPPTSPTSRPPTRAVGLDTGGTFTDFVAWQGGRLITFKLPSDPVSPERPVLEGLRRLGANRETQVRHGSTVATNTLLERKGARVTLVTTAGFEDLIEIGRQDRPDVYALAPRRAPPLVPPARRIGARERLGPRGETWRPLTSAEIERVTAAVARTRADAIAIGLLHAYSGGRHERALGRALAKLGIPVTLSSELCPEIREYERLSTTVLNAYLRPRVGRYLAALKRGTPARLEVVQSHGGTAPAAEAARVPVRQLLSGPAAGLVAAREVARACGFDRALTLDVGGTSTDCAFLAGELPRRRAREVAGFPVLLPLLDVHTVGAGGGSIASRDETGLLQVGPESGGANPGPACYGRGGPATVTDALVVLGRIPGDSLAGGTLRLERRAAERVLAALARALRLRGAVAAAEGVVRVAEAHIEAALRTVSIERGHDPREAALVAFGGAGGLHACAVAEALGVRTVLAPEGAGLLSALGALTGGLRREVSRTVLLAPDDPRLEQAWRRLEATVTSALAPAQGRRAPRLERWAEMRYAGQSHELPVPGGPNLVERFHQEHERRFGFADRGRAVQVVTIEARAVLPGQRPAPRARRSARRTAAEQTMVRHAGRAVRTAVWRREQLAATFQAAGPALVLESGATLWIPPGWRARMHESGTLLLTRGTR